MLNTTALRIAEFAREWRREAPLKMHSGTALGLDGDPQWHPDFDRWVGAIGGGGAHHSNPEGRLRLTRAMRQLRTVAPREYDVIYRVMVLGEDPEKTMYWLNDRAIRGEIGRASCRERVSY